jgi:diguanylate cyclase (GGDEF)-like protein
MLYTYRDRGGGEPPDPAADFDGVHVHTPRTPTVSGPRVEQALRASAAVALLVLGLLAAAGALRPDGPLVVDLVLVNVPYAACAAVCLLHARTDQARRGAWTAASAAMAAVVAGNLWSTLTAPVHPLVAGGFSVLGFVLLYLFVGLLLRTERPVFNDGVWLDGAVAALGIAALAAMGGRDGDGVHLAGVLVNLVLIMLVVIGGSLPGRRLDRTHVFVVAAFGAACVADGLALENSRGEPGYVLVLAVAMPALLAFAPTTAPPERQPDGAPARAGSSASAPSIVGWPTLTVPAFFSVSSLVLLVVGQSGNLPVLSSSLAAACVLAALGRVTLTFKELRDLRDVHQQARTDDLTGLPNRRALYEHLDTLSANARPGSLLLLDLDGFKQVNDTVGHAVGDQVLVRTADRIRDIVGPSRLLARLGGDEFAILMPGATVAEAVDLAWRIHVAITCPSHVADAQVRLGASIGATGTHLPAAGTDELLRTADIAMYVAKRRGGGVAAYQPPPPEPAPAPEPRPAEVGAAS